MQVPSQKVNDFQLYVAQKYISIFQLLLRELWKKDDDTITPIAVTNSEGLPSSFTYDVLVVGQDPGGTEEKVISIHEYLLFLWQLCDQ